MEHSEIKAAYVTLINGMTDEQLREIEERGARIAYDSTAEHVVVSLGLPTYEFYHEAVGIFPFVGIDPYQEAPNDVPFIRRALLEGVEQLLCQVDAYEARSGCDD